MGRAAKRDVTEPQVRSGLSGVWSQVREKGPWGEGGG